MPHSLIIGIAGGSASGKSTLTAALTEALHGQSDYRFAIITADHYFNSTRANAPTFVYSATGEPFFNADHPDAVDWEALLCDLDALIGREDAPDMIFIEGHVVFHQQDVRSRMDVRLFVDLDADERVMRRLVRDMHSGRVNPDPLFIANYYRECARLGHMRYIEPSRVYADLIVRGDADLQRVCPLIVAVLTDRLTRIHEGSIPRGSQQT